MERIEIIRECIDYLRKQGRNQSMNEDFQDGFEHAIWLLERLVGISKLKK